MMINVKGSDIPYWDDGNRNMYPWFRKGFWKRLYKKRYIRNRLKEDITES